MNNKKHHPKGTRGLVAYELVIKLVKDTLNMLDEIHGPGDLVSQARRAVISIPLNIAEGSGRRGNDRSYHFSIAYGSAKEVQAVLEIIRVLGLVEHTRIDALLTLSDRVNGLIWGLCGK